ncbi:MAG: hypothetical protein OXJ52_02355 [Oligoflexia bacterium]|nr:hypothetical protein [Oligoflexia bacterium]
MKKKEHRKYSQEYRQEVVELAKKPEISEASRELEIPLSCLQCWKSQKAVPVEKFQDVVTTGRSEKIKKTAVRRENDS